MSYELLPEWLNLILNDVETMLSLPILIFMILCTVQFILNHTMDIGCTVYENIKPETDDDEAAEKEKGDSLISKIKEFIQNLGFGQSYVDHNDEETLTAQPIRQNSQEEEWDYCEEDDD
ncbi:uncharacterized protein LOC116429473 [Nomia melanderi]|uniref:uncharacterized protein LOC116429473 n=1 Tax=Nomia melanderi TaxID=2448451 RepID=UPI0013040881|nr:uncharacterized protein LOC116429473 [Nomia melanderi]